MIAGLEAGELAATIRIGDQVVNDVAPRDRDIAMVFQNYALYPQMNVADNIGFGLQMRGLAEARGGRACQRGRRVLGLTRSSVADPGSCREGSASASPWAVRSCASPRCS